MSDSGIFGTTIGPFSQLNVSINDVVSCVTGRVVIIAILCVDGTLLKVFDSRTTFRYHHVTTPALDYYIHHYVFFQMV